MLLEQLSNAFGPSGCEDEVRELVRQTAESYCDNCSVDTMGNLICYKAGSKKKNDNKMMLTAHLDEIGLIVRNITDDGYLQFAAVGGIDARVLPGKAVVIGLKKQKGVIGAKPSHAKKGKTDEAPAVSDLYIDIGATSKKEAEEYAEIGDYACFDTKYAPLGNCIKGKALDDRIGCFILLELMKNTYPNDVYFVFTVQEEVGCRGARVAANVIQPQTAVVIEATTCADVPGTPAEEQCTQLGNGPAFTIKDSGTITHKGLTQELIETAKTHGVPWQYKQTVSGGNDAFAIQTSGAGVKVASVSVPCRYIHAPVSVASMRDISALQTILNAWLLRDEKL